MSTYPGLASVAALPHVVDLNLCNCGKITDHGLTSVSRLPQLAVLDVQVGNAVTADATV